MMTDIELVSTIMMYKERIENCKDIEIVFKKAKKDLEKQLKERKRNAKSKI
jgi:hypothetical protein